MKQRLFYEPPKAELFAKRPAQSVLVSFSLEGDASNFNGGHSFIPEDDYDGIGKLYDDSSLD